MNDDILKELDRLRQEGAGVLKAEAVVLAAKDKDSPLHSRFNWNVKEAAQQHWLSQARDLITTYTVVYRDRQLELVTGKTETAKRMPMFTPSPAHSSGYLSTTELLAGPDKRDVLIEEARTICWARRTIQEVSGRKRSWPKTGPQAPGKSRMAVMRRSML